jgi:hypothetical protein
MATDDKSNVLPVAEKVKNAVINFFRSMERQIDSISDETDLIRGTGASSDEGLDFALDLEEVLAVRVPDHFNPFVHPSGQRGMKLRELVEHAEQFIAADKGGDHGC